MIDANSQKTGERGATTSIRFLLAGSRRYPQHIAAIVYDLLAEADRYQKLAQHLAKKRGKLWRELAVRAASMRVEAQMLAAEAKVDFNGMVRTYIRAKLRKERRLAIYGR